MSDSEQATFSPETFLKAWSDYVTATQAICERLKNPAMAAAAATPLPLFGAWQDLAKALGMQADEFPAHPASALGWGREYQAIVQRMRDIGTQFQRCCANFSQQGAEISEQALRAARRRLETEPELAGSPADAYEAWIDCAEAAYAQAAHGETFSRSIGEICNLLGAFKVERGKLLDALARHLDIPSRAEVDSLHRQIRELSVAVRANASRPASKTRKPRTSRKPVNK